MDRERAKELLPLIEAFAFGAVIEMRPAEGCTWGVETEPGWTDGREYRIKPEPREFWVTFDADGLLVQVDKCVTKDCFKVVEVLE